MSENVTVSPNDAARDEIIEMRGLRFHFRDWPASRENAPSLVLLHGFRAMRCLGTRSPKR